MQTERSASKKIIVYYGILIGTAIFWIVNSRQFFIEQYMRFSLRNNYIVVSLSTTPYRINKISKVIHGILDQNAPINDVYLNVPYLFKRDNLEYQIPDWLQHNTKISILRTEDYGPATKLLGLLATVKLPPDTIVITLDDDIVYPKNTVLHLAYQSLKTPRHAIGLSGGDLYQPLEIMSPKDKPIGLKSHYDFDGNVTVLQGYAGIAYRAGFFEDSIFSMNDLAPSCIFSDDIYFSFYLAKNNIPRRTFANKFMRTTKINSDTYLSTSPNALQSLEPIPAIKNLDCIAYLQHKHPEVDFK